MRYYSICLKPIMLLPFFTMIYLCCLSAMARPISEASSVVNREVSSTGADSRTLSDIIWSCLATMFACTWVAVHPNVPAIDDGKAAILFRRLKIMMVGVVAPELIALWAFRQWLVARGLSKHWKAHNLTITHAFFISSGGFITSSAAGSLSILPDMIYNPQTPDSGYFGGRNVYTLAIPRPRVPVTAIMRTSKNEISDRSKGDMLSKGLALIQTTWFVMQVIARGLQHLPVTELEIFTVAFTVLSFTTYALWWNKPLDIRYPIPLDVDSKDIPDRSTASWPYKGWRSALYGKIILAFIGRENTVLSAMPITRIPSFSTGMDDPEQYQSHLFSRYIFMAFLATVFGIIHCIAWCFPFPSPAEQTSWRVCAFVITALPVVSCVFWANEYMFRHTTSAILKRVAGTVVWLSPPTIIIYLLARLVLLVEAFITLRSLPPEIYEDVRWTTFIPHI